MKRVLLSLAAFLAACGPATPAVDGGSDDTRPLINVFAAGPAELAQGQAATLVFHVVAGATATLEPGVGEVTGRTTVEVRPTQTTTFTLTATRGERVESASVTVTVRATDDGGTRPDAGLTGDGGMEPDAGAPTDGGRDPDAGVSSDAGTGSDPDAGVSSDGGTDPDAGASADAGTGTDPDAGASTDGGTDAGPGDTAALINVFAAAPAQLALGDASTLVFSVASGATATITPGVGDVTGRTTATVQPTQTTTYTLTATRSGRTETSTATVTVLPAVSRTASLRLATDAGVITAGVPVDVEVTMLDLAGAVDPTYAGTVQVAVDDAQATAPATLTFSAADLGRKTTQLTFRAAGVRTVTMGDVARPQVQGVLRVAVFAAAPQELRLSLDRTTARAGEALALTVRVVDAFGNAAPATGTLGFSSTDARLWVSSDRSLASADLGLKVLALALGTPGPQTVTVSLGALQATTGSIAVGSGDAASVAFAPVGTFASGAPGSVRLEVRDALGNLATDFSGRFTLATSDAAASLQPVDVTAADQGVKVFPVTLLTAGPQTLTATETQRPGLTTSAQVVVGPGALSGFRFSGLPATSRVGDAVSVTVTAVDAAGNTVTGFAGQARATSTDGAATLPADFGFGSGVQTVSVTFNTTGAQQVTVRQVGGAVSTDSASVTVSARPVVLSVSVAPDVLAGVAVPVTVAAKDDRGTAVPYVGTVSLAASQASTTSIAPASVTLTGSEGGVATFTVTSSQLGVQTLTATSGALTAEASTTVHGLVYTDPPVGVERMRLVRNAAASSASVVQLDLVVAALNLNSFATGFTLPMTAGRVRAATPLLVEGNAYTLGQAPKAVAAALVNGVLMAGVSQKASGAGAFPSDVAIAPGRVVFSVRLQLDPSATVGVVFDGSTLPAGFRAAVRNRAGSDVVEKHDFALGTLEVR